MDESLPSAPSMTMRADQLQKLLSLHESSTLSISSSTGSFTSGSSGIYRTNWIFDSRATYHMISNSSLFASIISPPNISVLAANGTQMSLAGDGTIVSFQLTLLDVYYILQLTLNLISFS